MSSAVQLLQQRKESLEAELEKVERTVWGPCAWHINAAVGHARMPVC